MLKLKVSVRSHMEIPASTKRLSGGNIHVHLQSELRRVLVLVLALNYSQFIISKVML